MITVLQNTRETVESRNELQRGRRDVRPHDQCEYKLGDEWSVLGQTLLLPCEEEKKEKDEVHSGKRRVFARG